MTKALIALANGSEEMESVIIIDTLRRADWDVVVVGITDKEITASRKVRIIADAILTEVDPASFDILVIPGGTEGSNAMRASSEFLDIVRQFAKSGKIMGAICAGPLVLHTAGVLNGCNATCYPTLQEKLTSANVLNERVVIDKNFVTSQGPGTTFDFALTLINIIDGEKTANRIRNEMLCQNN